jgi:hypothetical protein
MTGTMGSFGLPAPSVDDQKLIVLDGMLKDVMN